MPPRLECQTSRRESNAAAGRGEGLAGCRLAGTGFVRADLQVLCEKSGATVLLGNGDPAAGLASDLPLGRLHRPPGARCLARRAIMFFEFAESPAQGGSLPTSTANTTRRNAGVVECRLGLLTTFRATPSHPADSTDHRDVARSLSRLPGVPRRRAARRGPIVSSFRGSRRRPAARPATRGPCRAAAAGRPPGREAPALLRRAGGIATR